MTTLDPKYRPYLTRHQIEFLLSAIQSSDDTCAHEIRTSFNILLMKANAGIATGSYQPKKRKGLTDKLGFTYEDEDEARYLNGEMSPEEEIEYQNKLIGRDNL